MEEQNKTSEQIEFNSMAAILKRLDMITYNINESRQQRRLGEMADWITDYYKEISSDLAIAESEEIWNTIKKVKRFCNPLMPENQIMVLNILDELDIKLRASAAKHGYLTKHKKDVTKAVADMG